MTTKTDEHINYPDFIIVGAGKSGTTSLQKYLKLHPDIFMPEQKELWFLQLNKNPNKEILKRLSVPHTLELYTQAFQNAGSEKLKGEATPSYMMFPEYTISSIKEYFPDSKKQPKIVILLREPLEKILSLYRFNLLIGTETLPFDQALQQEEQRYNSYNKSIGFNYVRSSLYAQQVERFKKNFNNVGVFLFDELQSSPIEFMKEICLFLDIEFLTQYNSKTFYKTYNSSSISNFKWKKRVKYSVLNKLNSILQIFSLNSHIPQHVSKNLSYLQYKDTQFNDISNEHLQNLKKTFKKEITRLQAITNLDLTTWLRNYD